MRKAFTLIELMVTIAIIGILTSIATVSYSNVQLRGRDARRKSDLSTIKINLATYYASQTPPQYVASTTDATPGLITINGTTDALSAALSPSYIREMPVDPTNTGNYVYEYQSFITNGLQKDFNLSATLENTNDESGWGGGNSWVTFGYVVHND